MMFELEPEQLVLLQVFGAAMIILVIAERVVPNRHHQPGARAVHNVALQVINVALMFLIPFSLAAASLAALFNQFGLFNQATVFGIKFGLWSRIIICLLLIDLAMYWLHRAYHGIGLLWRFHRIHHGDAALDLFTTFRTHPVESLITFGTRAVLILLLGMPLVGVVLYEIIVAVWALVIHSNLRLWRTADRLIGLFLVTPSYHRLHHDADPEFRNSNFGLVLTVWDRLFGTIGSSTRFAEDGHKRRIGLTPAAKNDSLAGILLAPFRSH